MPMLHVHVHNACPCYMSMSMLHVHVNVHVQLYIYIEITEYQTVRHAVSPVLDWKKLRTGTGLSSHSPAFFLVWYWTKIRNAGMPMPALVSSMPMPSYGGELGLLLSLAPCNFQRNCRGVYLKHYSTRSFLELEPVTMHMKRGSAAEALSFFYLKALFITISRIFNLQSVVTCNLLQSVVPCNSYNP
jgi:hypothetical protein